MSLEDNSTITGTGSILDQFAKDFQLSQKQDKHETLPFNTRNKLFTLKQAREHVEFVIMMNKHKGELENLLKKLQAAEKECVEIDEVINDDGNYKHICDGDSDDKIGTTLTKAQEYFSKCDKISQKLRQSEYVENNAENCINEMPNIKLNSITDNLGRTLLHDACENGDYSLACYLLQAGSNPNAKKTCGVTPLGIAVIQKNKSLNLSMFQAQLNLLKRWS